ncbi:MAG TPA: alpha/beta fold hydrolase [Candidatus Saccharimonadales bacterium]|nr:alpha/beta fold hydrolase [Candidatus Saccharimonadales bacterium]
MKTLLLCAAALVIAGVLLLATLAGAREAPKVTAERVTVTTPDGVPLAGTWWAQGEKAPAVLLLHMLGHQRHDWDALSEQLAGAGYSVLAIDFRGHGESVKQGNRRLDYNDFSARDWKALPGDVTAALNWMVAQPKVETEHLGIVGASIGANSALLAAAGDKRVHSLVLLSPGLDYHGLKTERAMEQYGTRSIFLLASDDDDYSASTVRRLGTLARGRNSVKVFAKAGHGTNMFAAEPPLPGLILGWLKENL